MHTPKTYPLTGLGTKQQSILAGTLAENSKPKPTNWQGLAAFRVPPRNHARTPQRPALRVPGNELVGRAFGSVLRVDHEEHVREAGAEVSPVGVVVSRRLGRVGVLTLWAVKLHHGLSRHIGQSCTQGNHADSVKKQRDGARSPLGNKGQSLRYTTGHEEAERQSTLTLGQQGWSSQYTQRQQTKSPCCHFYRERQDGLVLTVDMTVTKVTLLPFLYLQKQVAPMNNHYHQLSLKLHMHLQYRGQLFVQTRYNLQTGYLQL